MPWPLGGPSPQTASTSSHSSSFNSTKNRITSKAAQATNSHNKKTPILLNQNRAMLTLVLLLLLPFGKALEQQQSAQPRPSCREHLLNGNARDGVLPILSQSGTVFWLECRFPPSSSQSARLSVQTIVRNALVGQWFGGHDDGGGDSTNEQIHVQQQVPEKDFLRQLLSESEECSQQVKIKWPSTTVDGGADSNRSNAQSVQVKTFNGQLLEFRRNGSAQNSHEQSLTIQSGPVTQIASPLPAGTSLSLGPLVCRQMLIPGPECQFELRADSDRVRVKLAQLRREAAPGSVLSIAFRTGRPSGRLLELLDGGNGPLGALDLLDGYLLFANHITHPAKLLADGLWHSIHLDLHSLSLRIDYLSTSLSLRASIEEGEPLWLDLLVHGELAALRLLHGSDGHRPDQWICGQRSDLLDIRQSPPQQHIFAKPAVCAPTPGEQNFCNCKGPNSALTPNGGIGRQSAVAQCPGVVEQEKAFHLSRFADRIAFFLVPNFTSKVPISVLFKSEEQSGLVFFGTYTMPSTGIPPRGMGMHGVGGGRELGGRVQVHFLGPTLFGALCVQLSDGTEKCLSCQIKMAKTFASSDRWVRVSLSYQLNQQFLAVDEQVCLLSPNAHAVDPAELYRITATNVLLVGGTFYAKHPLLSQRIADQFRRDFQDNTREKAPSLKGCIAEVVVRGQRQNLQQLLNAQLERAQREGTVGPSDAVAIFSLGYGCAQCPQKCNGAPCSRQLSPLAEPICQCASIHSSSIPSTGQCRAQSGQNAFDRSAPGQGGLPLSMVGKPQPIGQPLVVPLREPLGAPFGRQRQRLERIWLLVRLPEANAKMHPFIGIGSLQISIGENGHRVVVEARDYGILEEFLLPTPLDGRLHLISVERNPSIGTAGNGHLLTIRVDNALRHLHLDEIPVASLDGQLPRVELRPFHTGNGEGEDSKEMLQSGCIEELVFHYTSAGEELSTMAHSIGMQNQLQQLDYVDQFREHFPTLFPTKIDAESCGVRDPALWTANSSSWGRLGPADDDGPIGFILSKGSSLPRFSILITAALILVVLVSLSIYMFFTIKRHYSGQDEPMGKSSGGKNHFDKLNAEEHEKRPLKLLIEEEQPQQTDDRLPNGRQRQKPNGNAARNLDFPAPPRPPKSPRAAEYVMVNGTANEWTADMNGRNSRIGELLSIQPLDGSPKPIGAASLRVTPLRSQPLRNGRFHTVQSPLAVQRAHFFGTNPAPNDPTDKQQFSPSNSQGGGYGEINNNNNGKAQQWSSSGSAGFFTPSPTSGTSSTSPGGSNSSQGNELMRPPNMRVAATSRQHSPLSGSSAPIASHEDI